MVESLYDISDESLMRYVQEHNHQAFSILVERRSNFFYASAYRIVMNKQAAEDIVQEAFLKLWSQPAIWKEGKGAKFTTWFYKIVMNIALDWRRKEIKENKAEYIEGDVEGDFSQEEKILADEEQKALDKALKSLPESQLTALNLCFYEGVSNKEAADIMGVSVKALESLLMRAKAGIKDFLYREGVIKQGEVA